MGAMEVTLKNNLAELDRLTLVIEEFGTKHQWPLKLIYGINLALDELVTNVISYGYEDAGEHEIHVRFSVENEQLRLVIEDDGRPFNPLDVAEPDLTKPIEERDVGGLGIFLVRKTMDHVEYQRRANRNILTMTKHIQPPLPEAKARDGNN